MKKLVWTLKMRLSSSISDLPGKSGFFMRNSAKIQPTDHMSIDVLYSLAPSRSSGARYHNVTTIGVYGRSGEPYSRARPKSPIYTNTQKTLPQLLTFSNAIWKFTFSCTQLSLKMPPFSTYCSFYKYWLLLQYLVHRPSIPLVHL